MERTGAALRTPVEPYLESFRELDGRAPAWLRELRGQGMTRFTELGFPTPRMEEWKYTNVAPIAAVPFRLEAAPTTAPEARAVAAAAGPGADLVFVNGRFAPALSRAAGLPPGARLTSLAEAIRREPEVVRAHLAEIIDAETSGFAALSLAFVEDGAFLHLSKGTVVRDPIHLVFVSLPSGREGILSSPRTLIVAEENSEATIVETWTGAAGTSFTNAVTEISIGPNARVSHCKVQEEHVSAFHIASIEARLARSSRFESCSISLGAALARNDIRAVMDAEGAEVSLDGLYLVDGTRHVDHHTTIDHRKPHGTSRELYKGILDGRSTGVFNGKVYVRPDAQKSDARQMNQNLLLSANAEIDTKPELQIFADDVKCAHGATIGRLDENALFYLRARRIDRSAARDLLVFAFANEIVARVPIVAVRERLERTLASRLHAGPAEDVA